MTQHNSPHIPARQFGKWTVVGPVEAVFGGRLRHLLECQCECGTRRNIALDALVGGKSKQCRNCSNREKAALKSRLDHGMADTRLHQIWIQMRRRCSKETCPDFIRYGGRGIIVCDEWQAFPPFHDWAVANGYSDNLTIDRIDNNLGYAPSNCRWVGRTTQNRNRRDNVRYQFRGESLLLSEIAEITGVPLSRICNRVRRDGMTPDEAITKPFRKSPTNTKQGIAA